VAATTINRLLDYVMNTPEDGLTSAASVTTLHHIINNNKRVQQPENIYNKSAGESLV
jgi:4-O-beta-D-mannosyl-D-glucose phosphorylase